VTATRAPPRTAVLQQRTAPFPPNRKERALMDNDDRITEFLAAVDDLRGDDEDVRTTAHTSSVSDEGWPAAEAATGTAAA